MQTTIKQDEIMGKIGALSGAEKTKVIMEIQSATDKAKILNMFDHATVENQRLFNQAHEEIVKDIANEDNTRTSLNHLPNILAISKGTEGNRKQLFGAQETFRPETPEDEKKKRIGMGDLYKAMND